MGGLPQTVEFLDLKFIDGNFINFNLKNLKILKVRPINFNFLGKMPISLKYLEITDDNSLDDIHTENYREHVNYKIFPSNLQYLVLNDNTMTFENEDDIQLFQKKIKNLKYLSIDGSEEQKNILNNLPMNLSTIKFTKLSSEIDNLPVKLKKIHLSNDSEKKFLKKIPFNCTVHIKCPTDIEIIENYLINSKYDYSFHPKSISNNILNLDDIGIQYYSIRCWEYY